MCDYKHWKLVQLKEELCKKNVRVSGRKADLIGRLIFLYGYSGYTRGAHELLLTHSHGENILVDLVDSTDMNG